MSRRLNEQPVEILKVCFTVLQAAALMVTLSCSNSEKQDDEKGTLKEKQDKIAKEAVDYIKVPLEQAEKAAELVNEHNRQLEKDTPQE